MANQVKKVIKTVSIVASVVFSAIVIAQAPPPPGGAAPDFSKATETLGVTAAELATALGSPPNFITAAEKFDMPVEEFLSLLPAPPEADLPEGFTADDFMQPE